MRQGSGGRCSQVRESVSAQIDGEETPLTFEEVRSHLDGCEGCRTFQRTVIDVSRHGRVAAAEEVPDLTASILAACAEVDRSAGARRVRELRFLAGLTGVVQLLLALPLVFGVVGPELHAARDLGVLQLAMGVGFVLAAVDPSRARGLVPVVAAAVAASVFVVGFDLVTGRADLVAELTHVAEVAGLAALWSLALREPSALRLREAV